MSYPKVLILTPTYNHPHMTRVFLAGIQNILQSRPSVQMCILDNNSDEDTKQILSSLSLPNLEIHFLDKNIGKGNAINQYLRDVKFTHDLIVSLDSDILFSLESFDHLVQATVSIPKIGMLSMRYSTGPFNPERNLFFSQKYTGENGQTYQIKKPFMCNVAGGIFALSGTVLKEHLELELYPKSVGKTYYPDDAFLYDVLKKKGFISGYLEGTCATHLKSSKISLI